jgi:FkbM family methyltransferase
MYYIKSYFFQIVSKSKFITLFLHKIWVIYQYLRCKVKNIIFFKLKLKLHSLSDRGQDKWIVEIFNLKKSFYKGFFLEIGGGDGFCNSNTFILEKNYNWKGIIVEPNKKFFKKLIKVRNKSYVSNKLISNKNESLNFYVNGELSKIVSKDTRLDKKKIIKLKSIKLVDLLYKFNAPKVIDFFSLDVEGSEEKILNQQLLNKFKFNALCIERPSEKLYKLLKKNNYIFIKSKIYDCFFAHANFVKKKNMKIKKFIKFKSK